MLQAMNMRKTLSPLWEKAPGGARDSGEASGGRKSRAELRVQRDVEELSYDRYVVGRTVTRVNFPAGTSNLLRCMITICPREGSYDGAEIRFELLLGERYPFAPPRVTCHTRVFHPNIDWRNGAVSLGLLSASSWKPVLTINTVLFQLQTLFISPGSDLDNACNEDARRLFAMSGGNGAAGGNALGSPFDTFVKRTLKGGHFFGVKWASILADGGGSGGDGGGCSYNAPPPMLGRALSGDPNAPSVAAGGSGSGGSGFRGGLSSPRDHSHSHGPKRRVRGGKRSRDSSAERDLDTSSVTNGLNQLSILPQQPTSMSPGRQKRRREVDAFPGGGPLLAASGFDSSFSKRSRFGVQGSSPALDHIHAFNTPTAPHLRHTQQQQQQQGANPRQSHTALHGPAESFEPVKKRARPPHLSLNGGWSTASASPDSLSDADRSFHAQGVAQARRRPHIFPVNAFGSRAADDDDDADEKRLALGGDADGANSATPKPPRNRVRSTSGGSARSHSHSHSSRSPAQRSSLAPLLHSHSSRSPPRSSPTAASAENSGSGFGVRRLPRGEPAATAKLRAAAASSLQQPDFSMLNIGQHAHGQTVPFFGQQGQGPASASSSAVGVSGFDIGAQLLERVPPLRETSNFDSSSSAFSEASSAVGGLESSGSAMMDDDETENSGPCV